MTDQLGWEEIAARLALTFIAGILVGLNREESGRPAGLRTTLLVCLAASISMIQANLLLPTAGKPADSFVTLDLMRLPLGILTGMGFIGGGAILKKSDIVKGVTTAATLWFVTILGLCFGGGQKALGLIALVLGMIVLTGFKRLEALLPHDAHAVLKVTAALEGASEDEVLTSVREQGFHIKSAGVRYDHNQGSWTLHCELRWRARPNDPPRPALVADLARLPGVARLEWRPQGLPYGFEAAGDTVF